jgi:protocatechuate 3,4-dioxygenase beta subunit
MLTSVLLAATLLTAQLPPPPPPPPQGGPPRDVVRRPDPSGTGIIRGRVVAADTGNPIRRATVSLMPAPPSSPPPAAAGAGPVGATATTTIMVNGVPQTMSTSQLMGGVNMGRPRNVTTDAQGGFEFTDLPAGNYRLTANSSQYSPAYLSSAYGAKRANTMNSPDPGVPIELADGQRFDKATIALPRGAVITGRVTDDNGDPLARVQVYTMFLPPGGSRPLRSGSGAATDDLGQFRLFGLMPGDYLVVAESRGPTFVPPNAPPQSEEDKIGFLTTFFPGTADDGSAQRVRARAGGETPGVEIRMVSGRLFRLSGIVMDSQGRPAVRTGGSLGRANGGGFASFGFSTDEQGRFQMQNIPPGAYRLIVRGRPPQDGQNEPTEMAAMPVTVSADLEGITVITGPGATITGQVQFEQGPPALPPGQPSLNLRVNAVSADPLNMLGMPGPPSALVTPDFTFTMKGILGEYLLRIGGPNLYLKAVMLGAEDITDTGREFKNGDRVTMVMTSHASTLEGTVTDAKGAPVTDAAIVAFAEDKGAWRSSSVRTRRAGVDQNGHYRMQGLLAGRYYIIAVPRDRLSTAAMDASYFDQLAKEATTFIVGEDEQRQVDLKVAAGSGG